MKVSIYIEDGVTQLVLTPSNDFEKDVVSQAIPSGTHSVTVYRASFFECQGGWFRQANEDTSLILRVNDPTPEATNG